MTREEAIKIIDSTMTTYGEDAIDYDEVFEAKDMAIRSLEAWEKVREDVLKLEGLRYSSGIRVYQDEVIDIIDKHLKEV